MGAERPVHGVGRGLEVGEQRDARLEGGQLGGGDGREAGVLEGAFWGVSALGGLEVVGGFVENRRRGVRGGKYSRDEGVLRQAAV